MCASDHDPEPELADLNKIKSNLWTVTSNTERIGDVCERFQGLFTVEEKKYWSDLKDEQLKCFSFYAKLLQEQNQQSYQSLLLTALRSTGNSQVAEQIKLKRNLLQEKTNFGTDNPHALSGLEAPTKEPHLQPLRKPRSIQYEIKGRNQIYSNPEALKLSSSFQHKLTTLNMFDLQIALPILQKILQPCLSLENLSLKNVIFGCSSIVSTSTVNNSSSTGQPLPLLVLPQLKSYCYDCDKDSSVNYSWNTLFFFSLFGNQPSNLLNLWRNKMTISVKSQSMEIVMNDSIVVFTLPKKEFYDSPEFVPFIEKDCILSFFKELTPLESLTCLLPQKFDSIAFEDLPTNVRQLHVSGLNIEYSHCDGGQCSRLYRKVHLENCGLTQDFLEDISFIFPNATSISLKECQVNDDESGADVNILLT